MSEYSEVEKPFLTQLQALGWDIIDQGTAYPTDPAKSLRSHFGEWLLRVEFFTHVREINTTPDGETWLTDHQLQGLLDDLRNQPTHNLIEANEMIQKLMYQCHVDRNEVTGEESPTVKLIDFDNPENNHFLAINQFRIDTPGYGRQAIIPDIVLFVNGLPLVVIECKLHDPTTAQPLTEAFTQLMRYSNQREETRLSGLSEGRPELFFTNQFIIRTTRHKAQFGSLSATEEEYFYPWRSIWPEKYAAFDPPMGDIQQQETLIQGMLPKDTFLDIIRNCIVFMNAGPVRVKVVCRYQQYRAACRVLDRLRTKQTREERSGVIWHTQGSGKSLTMVFIIRMMRRVEDLKDYKICLINDRTDLEQQLTETAAMTGEAVTVIESSDQLKTKLSTDTSDLNMVMIHKFQERQQKGVTGELRKALMGNDLPTVLDFPLINPSDRILLMVDEAHRSQGGDFADNLQVAFPKAPRIGFTGTPLIKVQDADKTTTQFGDYIDEYRLQDAVDDGATVQIVYEGKTARTDIPDKSAFDAAFEHAVGYHVESQLRTAENQDVMKRAAIRENMLFEDLVAERSAKEILAIKKKWGTTGDLMEADKRIEAIAADIVNHYIDNILPNGFKAQVVCDSRRAAIKYKKYIDQALKNRLKLEQGKPARPADVTGMSDDELEQLRDDELCKRIAFLQSVVVISSDGTNEDAEITAARRHAKDVDAVTNFKKRFKFDKPEEKNTGIAFLIVCDMLLTGFDAPIEQIMYIDTIIKYHNLLQTIARVNRVAKGKDRGYIVDYVGLTKHLKEALSIYSEADQSKLAGGFVDIETEVPILQDRYRRLINVFAEHGIPAFEAFINQELTDTERSKQILESAIQLLGGNEAGFRRREIFIVCLKNFLRSMDIVLPDERAFVYRKAAKRFGYLLARVKQRYSDESLNIADIGAKVRHLIDQHLVSHGIDPKIPAVELFSDKFVEQIEQTGGTSSKASEMEHAIRRHCKINLDQDPAFFASISSRLEAAIIQYQNNWDELYREFCVIRNDAKSGRKDIVDGLDDQTMPFYARLAQLAFDSENVPAQHADQMKVLTQKIVNRIQTTLGFIGFWESSEVPRLKGDLSDLIIDSGIDELADHSQHVAEEIAKLAHARRKQLVEPS